MVSKDGVVRWGILGTANIATKVGRAIERAKDTVAVAIASRSLEKAKRWGERHNVGRCVGSYDELLKMPDLDAIYIPLPPALHKEWTIKAAEHGKHVLCEKPLAVDAIEARQMADACKRNNVQLMDGVFWVHHRRANAMRKVLDEGSLGPLKRITSGFTFRWDEVPQDNIRVKSDLAGGSLGDLGWYCVRATNWAFRETPIRVFATARWYQGIDMNLSALLWYNGDKMASFDCGFDAVYRNWFEVVGTKGSLVCDDFVLPKTEETARFWIHDANNKSETRVIHDCVQEVEMIEDFCAILRSGKLDERWPKETIANQRIVDLLLESARTGRPIEVKESIVEG